MKVEIFTDGGSRGNPGLAAAAFFVYDPQQHPIHQEGKFLGKKTNNEAEYEAFLVSLQWLKTNATALNITQVAWKLDSLLVVEQLNRHWKIKEARLQEFAQKIWRDLSAGALSYTINHIPRALNAAADSLVNQTLDQQI